MTMETRTVLRVIVTDNDIRKVTLPSKPQTLDSLIEQLGQFLDLPYTFSLQYEDADFNGALVNLTDIADLPEKPTLKVISLVTSPTPSQADTVIMSVTSQEESPLTRQDPWPETFEIPSFSVDVEYRLRQGNLLFMRDKTYLQVPRDMKHEVLEKLAEAMYKFKAYPREEDFNDVASALVKKHPCLFEPGSSTGWNGWKNSIKFKMGNYRSKLRRAGCTDVLVNSMKRGSQDSPRNVKKPKRFEINFLPNMPSGENESSMESKRLEIVEEMKKRHPSSSLIAQYMDITFSLRRKELVEKEPTVKETLQRWPALFRESQIIAEFNRITSKNLKQEFFSALDEHTSRFLEVFESKKGTAGKKLSEFLMQMKSANITDVTARRTAVLRGLAVLLGEDTTDFFHTCFDIDIVAPQVSIGILTVVPEDSPMSPQGLPLEVTDTAIILESVIAMDGLENVPHAMCFVFGLIYALNMEYPSQLKNTFEFIQRVFLSLGHKSLKPKLQSLKNLLF
ncbi:sterile alpha motif domain-containing protein 3-like [Carassius carassius]|uniref:sterile alpha motif domain-containing protein 3-like n=1 Tax=Carassius carassius TaxID=217509 RepID=UPI0028690499|nr:sterile alpha motif domain-containing protein 3-like [Carassius carassius]XP_059376926.1 sterile alpha motif domain-containing protein 3-like [Carassius carassius]